MRYHIENQTIMKYLIHHMIDMTDPECMRIQVGEVEADSLEEAFARSQNIEDDWNKEEPCRSTSVGDLIQEDEDFYIVDSVGFTKLI